MTASSERKAVFPDDRLTSTDVGGRRTFGSLEEFTAAKGETLGHSAWHEITQDQVNAFADVTGDHQWIHVDHERAASGPFGIPLS